MLTFVHFIELNTLKSIILRGGNAVKYRKTLKCVMGSFVRCLITSGRRL